MENNILGKTAVRRYNFAMLHIRQSICLLYLAITILSAYPAYSAAIPETVLEKIDIRYQNVMSLRSEFVQSEKLATLGRARTSRGVLFLKKPGLMRWAYSSPDEQTIVCDGVNLWMHYPGEKTAYRYELGPAELARTPIAILFGKDGGFREFFEASSSEPADEGLVRLELRSRHENREISSIWLIADPEDGKVSGTVIKDAFGNTTEIRLIRTEENIEIDDAIFTFEAPPGTTIQGGMDRETP